MVDLAKLRKKSKKKNADEASVDEPVVQPAAGPDVAGAVAASPNPATTLEAPAEEPRASSEPATVPSEPVKSTTPNDERTSKLERFMAEAGRKREATAGTAEVLDTNGQTEMLTFVIAGENYAVAIDDIVEIVRPRQVTRIPNADPSIVGITSLRGTIVTLVDAHLKLRHRSRPEATDETRVVVVDRNHEILGFTVDRVLRVVKVAEGSIEPPPIVHASEQHDAIRGVFRVANALTILLDLDKLLDHKSLVTGEGRASRPAIH